MLKSDIIKLGKKNKIDCSKCTKRMSISQKKSHSSENGIVLNSVSTNPTVKNNSITANIQIQKKTISRTNNQKKNTKSRPPQNFYMNTSQKKSKNNSSFAIHNNLARSDKNQTQKLTTIKNQDQISKTSYARQNSQMNSQNQQSFQNINQNKSNIISQVPQNQISNFENKFNNQSQKIENSVSSSNLKVSSRASEVLGIDLTQAINKGISITEILEKKKQEMIERKKEEQKKRLEKKKDFLSFLETKPQETEEMRSLQYKTEDTGPIKLE